MAHFRKHWQSAQATSKAPNCALHMAHHREAAWLQEERPLHGRNDHLCESNPSCALFPFNAIPITDKHEVEHRSCPLILPCRQLPQFINQYSTKLQPSQLMKIVSIPVLCFTRTVRTQITGPKSLECVASRCRILSGPVCFVFELRRFANHRSFQPPPPGFSFWKEGFLEKNGEGAPAICKSTTQRDKNSHKHVHGFPKEANATSPEFGLIPSHAVGLSTLLN